ncbi:Response regulator receiver protein (fragment) [Candidatus Sulfopaludibacter sp. SbA4]
MDDEPAVRLVLHHALTWHGYQVLDAEDYYTALETAASHDGPIDLLLTDIALPGLNGCELATKLLQRRPGMRVLLISGYVGSEICHYYRVNLGDLHFLAKPFTPSELLRRIKLLAGAAEPYPASLRPMPKTISAGRA